MKSILAQKSAALLGVMSSPKGKMALGLITFNYLQAIVTVLVNVFLANRLGEEGFGILGYGLIVSQIITAIVNFGNEKTLVRDLTHAENPAESMTASLVLRSCWAVLAGIGVLVWLSLSSMESKQFWPVIPCAIAGALMGLTPRGWFDFQYKMNIQAGLLFAEKLFYALAVVFLLSIELKTTGALVAASAFLLSRLLSMAAQWLYVLRSFRPQTNQLKKNLSWLFRQNLLVYIAILANLIAPYINQLYLGHKSGLESLGKYFVAFQIYIMIQTLQQMFNRLMGPRIAEITKPGNKVSFIRSRLFRFVSYSLLMNLSLLVPLIIGAGWGFRTFLKPEYAEAVLPFRILCTSTLFYGLGLVINQFLICLRLNFHYLAMSLSRGATALLLGLYLIPAYGLIGVAVTLLICRLVFLVVQFTLLWRGMNSIESGGMIVSPEEPAKEGDL